MEEEHSQIFMLTRVLKEKEKEMEEFLHKLSYQSVIEVIINLSLVLL